MLKTLFIFDQKHVLTQYQVEQSFLTLLLKVVYDTKRFYSKVNPRQTLEKNILGSFT
jgi:hypothetical protein